MHYPALVVREENDLSTLLTGMRKASAAGENAMEFARVLGQTTEVNMTTAVEIAYDLQSGSYVDDAIRDPEANERWCQQLAGILEPLTSGSETVIEVGCGEATTLSGVADQLGLSAESTYGFDIAWSRVRVAQQWMQRQNLSANVFVADLFRIPCPANRFDVVYTSHSIEPNGGRESEAIAELLRISCEWVVLVEPLFELADEAARRRMAWHGYVRDLAAVAVRLGAEIVDYRLLDLTPNPLNPSGLVLLRKPRADNRESGWRCPLTGTVLKDYGDLFYSSETGIAYPVVRGIPMLKVEHAILASQLSQDLES